MRFIRERKHTLFVELRHVLSHKSHCRKVEYVGQQTRVSTGIEKLSMLANKQECRRASHGNNILDKDP
jgi:alanine-alpha-ketoisovalerate/valine-pyruvate aminotransferase